jgi:hypothetical protein
MGIGAVARLGDLARHSSNGRAEVVDAIPDLSDDHDPGSTVAKTDVDRQRRILWPRRSLEAPLAIVRRGKPKEQFLCGEMSGVLRLGHEITAEPDGQWSPKSDPDGRPGGDRRSLPGTRLEVANLRLAETDPLT